MKRIFSVALCSFLGLGAACTTTPTERPSSSPASATPVGHAPGPPSATGEPQAKASASATGAADVDPAAIPRISAAQVRKKVQAGEALLVCAYGDRTKCGGMKLEGSMAYADLAAKLSELGKDAEIILYCA